MLCMHHKTLHEKISMIFEQRLAASSSLSLQQRSIK